jgi:hypothetical protein
MRKSVHGCGAGKSIEAVLVNIQVRVGCCHSMPLWARTRRRRTAMSAAEPASLQAEPICVREALGAGKTRRRSKVKVTKPGS